jgi:MOSC domain-containing protein YiiM
MRVISVNVGQPREVDWHGRAVTTSIWKTPVAGPVRVGATNLDGDRQSDLTVHGGREKSVYVYPSEHYEAWRRDLPGVDLPWGVFGENLTIEGLLEGEIRPGDRLRIGSAELEITVPRLPCYKLGIRFGDDLMVKRFARSGRSGFYLSVIVEGTLEAGDAIVFDPRAEDDVTIADLFADRV